MVVITIYSDYKGNIDIVTDKEVSVQLIRAAKSVFKRWRKWVPMDKFLYYEWIESIEDMAPHPIFSSRTKEIVEKYDKIRLVIALKYDIEELFSKYRLKVKLNYKPKIGDNLIDEVDDYLVDGECIL